MLAIMKMLWLVLSILLLHQAVSMKMVREPVEEMSEIAQVTVSEKANSVECPDPEWSCPDNTTCCKTKDRVWACCPLPDAVCCKDGEHCCPKGYTCDVSAGSCLQESETIEILRTKPANAIKESKVNIVSCNATTYCEDGQTCCKLASGEWGCCPLPNAVCCSDGEHCCPSGSTCISGQCQRGSHVIKLFTKTSAIQVKQVICPDGQSMCPDGNTCCKLASGGWGCCPYASAVCCSDGEHCCPSGSTCISGQCLWGSHVIKLFTKAPAIQVKQVICPDGQSMCPDGNTCCKLASGGWGCCPYASAVCCSDGEHCCPSGYTCTSGQCQRGSHVIKLFTKAPAIQVKQVICPDGQSMCPDGNTCCKLASGGWGCCPYASAVCCSDGEHCCPSGYTCTSGQCQRGSHVIKLFRKAPAIQVKQVICPDGQSMCPDGNTCCKLASGGWGCCPYASAVCCSDGEHCCPSGYTCTSGQCQRGSHVIKLFRKAPAIQVKQVICPDGQSECPDGNTCCKLPSGEWGCCPLPEAVCCSDHTHCCPQGTTCDVSEGKCLSGLKAVADLSTIQSALKVKGVVCPGGQYECPDGNTCCRGPSGNWVCCTLPEAVCCSDHLHCCPHGTTCDLSIGKCVQGLKAIADLSTIQPALKPKKAVEVK